MTEQIETLEQVTESETNAPFASSYQETKIDSSIIPQAGCGTCGTVEASGEPGSGENGTAQYVYAIGRIEARFPNLASEKEFAQVAGRTDTSGKTDQATFSDVLSKRENRFWHANFAGC